MEQANIKREVKRLESFRNWMALVYFCIPILAAGVTVVNAGSPWLYVVLFLALEIFAKSFDWAMIQSHLNQLYSQFSTSNLNELIVRGRVRPEVNDIIDSGRMSEQELIDHLVEQEASPPAHMRTIAFFSNYGLPFIYFLVGGLVVLLSSN